MSTYRVAVRLCDEPGCSRPHYALGLCQRHYMKDRNRRLGIHAGPRSGDDWYRARIEAGHEWVSTPGLYDDRGVRVMRLLPQIEDEPWEPMSSCEGLTDLLAADPEDSSLSADVPRRVRAAMNRLPERERRILELRFGFEGEPWTLEAVAHEFDYSLQRIQQLETHALKWLKGALANGHTFSDPPPAPPPSHRLLQQWFPIPAEEVGPPLQMLQAVPPVPCPCCGARLDYPDHHHCVLEWLEAQK